MRFSAQYELMIHGVYGKKSELLQQYIITINFLPNMYKIANQNARIS
jgi:hypothetical protein